MPRHPLISDHLPRRYSNRVHGTFLFLGPGLLQLGRHAGSQAVGPFPKCDLLSIGRLTFGLVRRAGGE